MHVVNVLTYACIFFASIIARREAGVLSTLRKLIGMRCVLEGTLLACRAARQKAFVFCKQKSRHCCPMKPHTFENVEHSAYPSSATLAHTMSESRGAEPVPGRAFFAGWGAAIWEASFLSPSPKLELYGPVCTTVADLRWIGEGSAKNHTSELTAMVKAPV